MGGVKIRNTTPRNLATIRSYVRHLMGPDTPWEIIKDIPDIRAYWRDVCRKAKAGVTK